VKSETEHEQWLRRLDATGRAQARYLWILLLACLFFFSLRQSEASSQQISVPVLDLKLNAAAVLASGGTIIAFIVVASFGAIAAWSRALQQYGGDDWRQIAERLDIHPNALDLAIYSRPESSKAFARIGYFVYPLYLTVALVESVWLQWWLWNSAALGKIFFSIAWLLIWSRAVFLLVQVWLQRISRLKASFHAG
jgi:hypothetical protein